MKISKLFGVTLLATLGLAATGAQAGVVYEFVCDEPTDCANDNKFGMQVELANSVITPNGTYSTGSDGGAGLVGWRFKSVTGNGFHAHGTSQHVTGSKSHVAFSFDENGVISGLYTTEKTGNEPLQANAEDTVDFSVVGVGKVTWAEPGEIVLRADQSCPPDPSGLFCLNKEKVQGHWRRVSG